MKVTCQSCQARYTIADDKVRGKVAKIRCKKCGTTILVDGTDGAATAGPAPASGAAAVESLPLGPTNEAAAEPLSVQESPMATPAAEPVAAKPAIKAPEPVALRRPGRAASTDLFGGARGAEVLASPSPSLPHAHADAGTEKLTGARNENSVLFSLSALTGGSNAQPAASEAAPNSRSADLRSLIGTTSGSSASKDKSKLDDIMNLGGGGLYSPALISPALAPPPLELSVSTSETSGARKGKGRLFLIVGAVVLVGGVATAMTVLKTESAPTAASGSSTASAGNAALAALGTATANNTAMALTAANPTTTEAPTPAAVAPAPTPEPTAAPAPTALAPGQPQPKPEAEKKPAWTPPTAAAPKLEKVAAAPVAEKPVEKTAPAPAPPPAAAPKPAPAGGTGEFDRAAALSALSNVALAARACKKPDGPTGSGRVTITFANNGIATTATIEGPPFAGTAVGGCVAGRFRAASVPPFGGSPVTVHKTFTIE